LSENLSELLKPHCLRISAWKKYTELRAKMSKEDALKMLREEEEAKRAKL
jgi:hypothetical protein